MSDSLGFKPKYVFKIAEDVLNNLLDKLDTTSKEINLVAAIGTEKTMVERLKLQIESNAKRFKKRLFTATK